MSSTLDFDIKLSQNPTPQQERERILANPGWGQHFTDHMITIRYSADRGWHDARLEPYGPLTLDPATSVFHYAQELFEGLKAYRQVGGSIVMFRPYANAARCTSSPATVRRMLQDSLLEVALFLLVLLAVTGAVLGALFVVVRAAVDQGIRRALRDRALRPSLRDLLHG